MPILKDFALSTITAGFVASLVGLTSGIVLVFQAARALGADEAQTASWVWALCLGMAVLTIVPSLRLRVPVMVAFSAPGAAILATLTPGDFTLSQAIGAFIVNGVLMAVVGFSGLFERFMDRIPLPLVSALLGGVLARFVISGFADATTAPWLIAITTIVFMVARRVAPRYSVLAVLIVGIGISIISRSIATEELVWSLARPVYMAPTFNLGAIISLSLPLFIVTMAGQNLPGVAAFRQAKYEAPISKLVGTTGVGTIVLAPFGGYAFNLSAVSAPLCLEAPAHEDPARRYTAALSNGGFYLLAGLFGTSITGALRAFPTELIQIVAALALLPTIGNSLGAAVSAPEHREAAMFTFVITLSGVTIAKIGSPFWGVLAGVLAMVIASVRSSR
ncbi:MAG: benzoate/H(+) symporter BenE family transporter [Actinomycetota bacterium]|nr:benzoate/H(+) symporter BenE family transporter [Actinomycetota bacterium]